MALARRVQGGLALAQAYPDAILFCSGGFGRHGPSEAAIMVALLKAQGVAPERLVLDEQSQDTLQNVMAASRFVLARRRGPVIVCTDSYHAPRARIIFAALGVATRSGAVACGWRHTGAAYWLRVRLREALAIPYDGVLALARRRRFLHLANRTPG